MLRSGIASSPGCPNDETLLENDGAKSVSVTRRGSRHAGRRFSSACPSNMPHALLILALVALLAAPVAQGRPEY
jgi:hypothetical protein